MSDSKKPSGLPAIVACFTALQILLILFVLIPPFGFDRPSSWGLDVGHFLLAIVAYPVVWLIGVVIACVQKRWGWVLLQMIILVVGLGLFFAFEY